MRKFKCYNIFEFTTQYPLIHDHSSTSPSKIVSTISTTSSFPTNTWKYYTLMTFPNISMTIEWSFLPLNVYFHLFHFHREGDSLSSSLCLLCNTRCHQNNKAFINIRKYLLQVILKMYLVIEIIKLNALTNHEHNFHS